MISCCCDLRPKPTTASTRWVLAYGSFSSRPGARKTLSLRCVPNSMFSNRARARMSSALSTTCLTPDCSLNPLRQKRPRFADAHQWADRGIRYGLAIVVMPVFPKILMGGAYFLRGKSWPIHVGRRRQRSRATRRITDAVASMMQRWTVSALSPLAHSCS